MAKESDLSKPQRLAKVIARAGLCSRREAERWIQQRRVLVDGHSVETPAYFVQKSQVVQVDGRPLPAQTSKEARLWQYYKPRGTLVTTVGQDTVFQRIESAYPQGIETRLIAVGRLDFLSEGLLLFSNHGSVTRFLELPKTGWKRRYRVRVFGDVQASVLEGLAQGITIKGIYYEPIEATLDCANRSNAWITMTLREGKNREIRRIMEHFGWTVQRLIRVAYGPFSLKDLKVGELVELSRKVVRASLGQYFLADF